MFIKKLNLNKINLIKTIKIAIGSSIAILIANSLGLQNSLSAGIITLLSIQDTKKETLLIALKRLLAFTLATIIAYLLFENLGYKPYVFGIFLMIFVASSYLFELEDGISMCSVLTTHFLIEKSMDLPFIGNEFLLLFIGTLIAILLNMYMPNKLEVIKNDIQLIEKHIQRILNLMSVCIIGRGCQKDGLTCKDTCYFSEELIALEKHINNGINRAYHNINNVLLSDTRYYLRYFIMRKNQYDILKRINEQILLLTDSPKQSLPISELIKEVARTFHESNDGEDLLLQLKEMMEKFREEANPVSRDEFENRAVLFMIMKDLENFLRIKQRFSKLEG